MFFLDEEVTREHTKELLPEEFASIGDLLQKRTLFAENSGKVLSPVPVYAT